MKRVKLISDGTIPGTRLLNEDGTEIPNIRRIEISTLDANNPGMIVVKVELVNVELDLDAHIKDEPA